MVKASWVAALFFSATVANAGSGVPQIFLGDNCLSYTAWSRLAAYERDAGTLQETVIQFAERVREEGPLRDRVMFIIKLVFEKYPQMEPGEVGRLVWELCNGVETKFELLGLC